MSVSSVTSSNEGLSALLPNSSDEEKLLRRSTRRRRKSYWLQPSSDFEPEDVIGQNSSPPVASLWGNDIIETNGRVDVRMDTESPVSHKKTRRRSPRRLPASAKTDPFNISSLSSMSSNCDEQVDMEGISLVPIHSSKEGENIDAENEVNIQKVTKKDEHVSNKEGGKLRRSNRRRSLAVHNGSLLLGTSSNINCDISSSTNDDHNKESDLREEDILKSHQVSISKHQAPIGLKESIQQSPSILSKVRNDVPNESLSHGESSKDQHAKKSSPVSITGDIEIRQSHPMVSSEMIISIMNRYFGASLSATKPSMTPRLFACVICLLEQRYSYVDPNHSLIRLMKAYAGAEEASLRDLEMNEKYCAKKISFCSYDMSSMISPIDTILDSNLIVENCIDALHHIIEVINSLSCMKNDNFTEILNASVSILRRIHNDDLLALSCAKVGNINSNCKSILSFF